MHSMAHTRIRHLTEHYKELLGFSPLLGLLGHRQVGKTTFLELNSKKYLTFDDEDTATEATVSPKKFILRLKTPQTAIDESQLVPGIFPALKERVRLSKRPGQIILSGSVRFTSKASIRESLTGRIQYLELLPFSISELQGDPLTSRLDNIFKARTISSLARDLDLNPSLQSEKMKVMEHYMSKGGLPGLCFIRKDGLRRDKMLDQLKTILDRDLRQIYRTRLTFDELVHYLSEMALFEGRPYDYQHFRRLTGLSPITQKQLLYAFEAIFLIRRVPVEGDVNTFSIFLEDQGESHFLSDGKLARSTQVMGLLYRNLRTEYFYRSGSSVNAFQFKNRSGSVVPMAFNAGDAVVGFLYSASALPDRKTRGTAGVFLKYYANAKVIIVHEGQETHEIGPRVLSCPISCLI